MVTKMQAQGAKVDWDAVERATEIRRTYLIVTKNGREFFKMYKPSEVAHVLKNEPGWSAYMIGTRK